MQFQSFFSRLWIEDLLVLSANSVDGILEDVWMREAVLKLILERVEGYLEDLVLMVLREICLMRL